MACIPATTDFKRNTNAWSALKLWIGSLTRASVLLPLTNALSGDQHSDRTSKIYSLSAQHEEIPPHAINNEKLERRQNSLLLNLPMAFEVNKGQANDGILFTAKGSGYATFLRTTDFTLVVQRQPETAIQKGAQENDGSISAVRFSFVGSQPPSKITGVDELKGHANYFIGSDPRGWITGVPTFAKVKYTAVYPGIDVVYYGNQRRLEYDFIVAPGSDPRAILTFPPKVSQSD